MNVDIGWLARIKQFVAAMRKSQHNAHYPAFYLQLWGAGAERKSALLVDRSIAQPIVALNIISAIPHQQTVAIWFRTLGVTTADSPTWLHEDIHEGTPLYTLPAFDAYATATVLFVVPADCAQIEFTTLSTAGHVEDDYTLDLVKRVPERDLFYYRQTSTLEIAHMASPAPCVWQRTRRFHIPTASTLTRPVNSDVYASDETLASSMLQGAAAP